MDYRVLERIAEFEAAVNLEVAVWGLDPRDAVPVNMLRALQHAGGALIAAYDGEEIVGITLGFPARSGQRWILWSHMTGVHRKYQGQNIGFELKLHQRAWALASGFDEIHWTFDPLQRGNANFNIHRLGATSSQYYINFYGVMEDQINHADIPSDRIEGAWPLNDPRVIECIRKSSGVVNLDRPYLLADNGSPAAAPLDTAEPEYLVQIPHSLADGSHSGTSMAWRLALREALTRAFEHGYAIVDFTAANAYLLRRS